MNVHDATEVAYKNGYKKGFADGKADVVHCKECNSWSDEEQSCIYRNGFQENDFCSQGERRKYETDSHISFR